MKLSLQYPLYIIHTTYAFLYSKSITLIIILINWFLNNYILIIITIIFFFFFYI